MKVKLKLILSLMLVSMLLTGCWDSTEINQKHVVLEIAADKYEEAEPTEGLSKQNYDITYMIPDSSKLIGEESLSEEVKTKITSQSATIGKSIEEIETKTQNTLDFSHIKAVIVGKQLLEDKVLFKSCVDSLVADVKIGRGTNILVTKGKASDITGSDNYKNPVIGLYIMKYFDNNDRGTGYVREQVLGEMIKEIQETGVTTIPLVEMDQEGTIKVSGAAIVKDYELVDWLSGEDVRGKLFIEGKVKKVPIVVPYHNQYLTYEIRNQSRDIKFVDPSQVVIDIILRGSITEYVSLDNGEVKKNIDHISQIVSQEVQNQIEHVIQYSKDINVDFIDIGLEMSRKEPELWKKYVDRWQNQGYQEMQIKVNVKTIIEDVNL